MSSWQKRARLGVATFTVAFGVVVYFAMGERQAAAPVIPVERQDPKASLEVVSGVLQQLTNIQQDYEIQADSWLTYDDGSVKMPGVRIIAKKRDGRDFVISAKEARAGPDRKQLALSGEVVLTASDGFHLETSSATFNQDDGIARAPGPVTFGRGRMSGSGVGMSYDERSDVLAITASSRVTLADDAGAGAMAFEAGPATLDRMANVLTLEGGVHVLRDMQEIDGDRAVARLSDEEAFVTFVEIRGNARVAGGGGSLAAMRARDIDLDYTDDGQLLERVLLTGDAAVGMTGAAGSAGREILGGRLDLALAADGAVTKAIGSDGVSLWLQPDDDAPSRVITAQRLDGDGAAGRGLTSVQFDEAVQYREVTGRAVARQAHSQALRTALDGDTVIDAVFTGRATFQDRGLEARAAEARYSPGKGTLRLSGTDAGGGPRVSDEEIIVEASTVDLAFEGRQMTAMGGVRTTLKSAQPGPADRRAPRERASRRPGLLKQEQPVTVNAGSLDYGGGAGQAVYTGGAVLTQGEDTVIRATAITIDQEAGNLTAAGSARSWLAVDGSTSQGNADEIRYDDAKRVIVYSTKAPGVSRVNGPQGDLRAGNIVITLEREGSRATRLDAQRAVSITLETLTVTGARLEYQAATERYVVYGSGGTQVSLVDRSSGGCRQSTGMKLTFSKSADNIIIDGEEQVRTKTGRGGPCGQAPPTPPPASAPSR
jgi:LPS export ABC transporter protein LptC